MVAVGRAANEVVCIDEGGWWHRGKMNEDVESGRVVGQMAVPWNLRGLLGAGLGAKLGLERGCRGAEAYPCVPGRISPIGLLTWDSTKRARSWNRGMQPREIITTISVLLLLVYECLCIMGTVCWL